MIDFFIFLSSSWDHAVPGCGTLSSGWAVQWYWCPETSRDPEARAGMGETSLSLTEWLGLEGILKVI